MRNRSKLLARACLLFVLLPLFPAPSVAGDTEFHSLVERVSAYYQMRPMRFMGLLDFVANRFTPQGGQPPRDGDFRGRGFLPDAPR